MGVPKLDKLHEYLKLFARARPELYTMRKKQLYLLRGKLRRAMKDISTWSGILKRGRWKLQSESKELILQAHNEAQVFRVELFACIVDIEEQEALHKEWKTMLLPEPAPEGLPLIEYPLLAPYESDDLSREVDESWFPVKVSGMEVAL
jgi:hypothetical protein